MRIDDLSRRKRNMKFKWYSYLLRIIFLLALDTLLGFVFYAMYKDGFIVEMIFMGGWIAIAFLIFLHYFILFISSDDL